VNHDMHDGGYVWLEEEDRVNEAIVLVGDIPCLMSGPTQNERHHEKSTGTQVVQKCLPHRDEPEGKRAQIMFDAGREIVSPEYSKEPKVEVLTRQISRQPTRGVGACVRPDPGNMPDKSLQKHEQGSRPRGDTAKAPAERQSRRIPQPRWCPVGLTKTQWRRLQKMRKNELEQEKAKKARDNCFNQARPIVEMKKTSREKRRAREEHSNSEDNSQDDSTVGEDMKINMVFELSMEFLALEENVVEFALGARAASFEKPEKLG
jgi:hypothetical protein